MTYTQARLIIWCHSAYTPKKVREAALFILSKIGAKREDIDQACSLI